MNFGNLERPKAKADVVPDTDAYNEIDDQFAIAYMPANKICYYPIKNTVSEASQYAEGRPWSRIIWDVTAVAWLLDGRFFEERLEKSPIPEYDGHYAYDGSRHFIKYIYHVHRDELVADLFEKLTTFFTPLTFKGSNPLA